MFYSSYHNSNVSEIPITPYANFKPELPFTDEYSEFPSPKSS